MFNSSYRFLRNASLTAILLCTVCIGIFQTPALAQSPPTGKLPQGITPTHYVLDLQITPDEERFTGQTKIEIMLDATTTLVWLHGRDLQVTNAHAALPNGTQIAAQYAEIGDSGAAKLTFEQAVGPGPATLVLDYTAGFNQSLEGLYRVKRGEMAYVYTHFEPLSARRMFPGFDEPRFKTQFDISVTIPASNVAISNAPERETIPLGNKLKRVVFQTTEPISTYLVALAVGDFDVVEWEAIPGNSIRTKSIPLRGIAPKGKGGKLGHALTHTGEMLAILEEYFGIPYPYAKLDIVAAAEFNSGGMENVAAIFYDQRHVLIDDNPSIYQLRNYASIHAHELAHSWFGNLVTPAWWDDLWLKEAFATWMSHRVVQAWRPKEFNDRGSLRGAHWAMWSDRFVSARQIRQPIESDHDIAGAFDGITYSKGGGVLSMVETYLGEELFRQGVRIFLERHRHGVASAEDFFKSLSDAAGDPAVIGALRSFVDKPGTPLVEVNWTCDDDGAAKVSLKQSRALPLGSKGDAKKTWAIPLCLAYPHGDTRRSKCILMSEPRATVTLETNACPAWILPNKAGAAYVKFSLPERGWTGLLDNQHLLRPGEIMSVMDSLVAAYDSGRSNLTNVYNAAQKLANSQKWDVARAPMQSLRNLKNYVLPIGQRGAFLTKMQNIYALTLARFDLSDQGLAGEAASNELALLRSEAIWFMAIDALEPNLRARLSRLGQAYLGYGTDGQIHSQVLHPNLVRVALSTAAGNVGLPLVEAMIERLRTSDDAVLRNNLIAALGMQTDPVLAARVRTLVLDTETPGHIASQLLRRQARRVDNGEALLDWITENYDALLAKLPRRHRAWVVWRHSALCSKTARDRVQAFYVDRVQQHPGAPRALENVLEQIEICAATVTAQRAGALKVLQARK